MSIRKYVNGGEKRIKIRQVSHTVFFNGYSFIREYNGIILHAFYLSYEIKKIALERKL